MDKHSTEGVVSYIHYDPVRTDYTVTEQELTMLRAAGQNSGKDLFLVFVSLAVPCLVNAFGGDTPSRFSLTRALFLNYVVGFVCLAAAVVCLVMWLKTRTSLGAIEDAIRQKPLCKSRREPRVTST